MNVLYTDYTAKPNNSVEYLYCTAAVLYLYNVLIVYKYYTIQSSQGYEKVAKTCLRKYSHKNIHMTRSKVHSQTRSFGETRIEK